MSSRGRIMRLAVLLALASLLAIPPASAAPSFTRLANPNILPTELGEETAWSHSGTYLAWGGDAVVLPAHAGFQIYKRVGTTLTQLPNPATVNLCEAAHISFNADDSLLAVIWDCQPALRVYSRVGDTFTAVFAATLPDIQGGLAWSGDGTILATGDIGSNTCLCNDHSWLVTAGPTFTPLNDNAEANGVYSVSLNFDGTVLASSGTWNCDTMGGCFMRVYTRAAGGNVWSKRYELPAQSYSVWINGLSFSDDGTMLAAVRGCKGNNCAGQPNINPLLWFGISGSGPGLSVTTFSPPTTDGSFDGWNSIWDHTGTYIYMSSDAATSTAPQLHAWSRNGTTLTTSSAPAFAGNPATGLTLGMSLSGDNKWYASAITTSPFIAAWQTAGLPVPRQGPAPADFAGPNGLIYNGNRTIIANTLGIPEPAVGVWYGLLFLAIGLFLGWKIGARAGSATIGAVVGGSLATTANFVIGTWHAWVVFLLLLAAIAIGTIATGRGDDEA